MFYHRLYNAAIILINLLFLNLTSSAAADVSEGRSSEYFLPGPLVPTSSVAGKFSIHTPGWRDQNKNNEIQRNF